jgi:hypothetical protein
VSCYDIRKRREAHRVIGIVRSEVGRKEGKIVILNILMAAKAY